jgi:hypothetical protein
MSVTWEISVTIGCIDIRELHESRQH